MPKGVHPSDKLVLQHEMFILDANLIGALDQSQMHTITNDLIDNLLVAMKMKKLGHLEIYDATDPRAPGWSFIQPITTSHISGHYFVEPDGTNPNIHMDFYSCRSFQWGAIIPIVHRHLRLGKWHADFLYRKDVKADRTILAISGDGEKVISKNFLVHQTYDMRKSERKVTIARPKGLVGAVM